MRRFLLTIFLCPLLSFGQANLCGNCAYTLVDPNDLSKCCENCLREYYTRQLRRNITHGKLSTHYDYEVWSTFIPLPDTLTAHFKVFKIVKNNGYYQKSSELIESTYYLFNLSCEDSSVIQPGTSIVLISNDSSLFKEGETYYLSLLPYFRRNQSFRICDGKIYTVVGGATTLFDLVYKEWLVVMLPVGRNYFFLK